MRYTWGKIIHYSIVAFALALLQACNTLEESKAQTGVKEQILVGYYIYGHEVNSFQPCGQKGVFWVTGSEEIHESFQQKYKELTSQPYDEVFVELVGTFIGKASDGFAMDYDGQVLVIKIHSIKKKSARDCN